MKLSRLRAPLALALLLPIAGCEQRATESTPHPEPEFYVGIGTHLTSPRGLDLIRGAGIHWLRDDIHWSQVEREKGSLAMPARYEEYVAAALQRGIQPLLILCYGNRHYDDGGFPVSDEALEGFARFAEFVVSHFKGRVRCYEIWNEWNIGLSMPPGTGPGDAKEYVKLLRRVYPRLKAIDPDLLVLGGAIAGTGVEDDGEGWLQTACASGLLKHLDGLSFHPYCYGASDLERLPERGFLKRVLDVRAVVEQHAAGRDVPLYITEIGWPNHIGASGSSQEDSARFLARMFLLSRTVPSVKGVWWYDWRDDGLDPGDREHNFGIVAHDLTPKPAYFAMRDVNRLFNETRFDAEIQTEAQIRALRFEDRAGGSVMAMWSFTDAARCGVIVSTSTKPPAEASLKQMGRDAIAVPWTKQEDGTWEIHLTLSASPCWLFTGTPRVNVTPTTITEASDAASSD